MLSLFDRALRPATRLALPRCAALLAVGAMLLCHPATGQAQAIGVEPHVVVVDPVTRSATVTLMNRSDRPVEAAIGVAYGYAVSDSAGRSVVVYPDSLTPLDRSAASWVSAFPRRVTIPPMASQVVRFRADPPDSLAAGEWWARVVIAARGGSVPVSKAGVDTSAITVGLNVEMRTIIPVFFQQGRADAGIAIDSLAGGWGVGDSLEVRGVLHRTGSAAWIGAAFVRVRDAVTGRVLLEQVRPHAVYFGTRPVWRFAVPAFPASVVPMLDVDFRPIRADVPRERRVQSASASQSVRIPARVP